MRALTVPPKPGSGRGSSEGATLPFVVASIDLLVPTAHPLVGEWYDLTDAAAGGMPPHITLLWPWELSQSGVDRLEAALTTTEPFEIALSTTGRFPGVLYLALEPCDGLLGLMRTIWAALPEWPPYRGELDHEPIPHLTAAKSSDEGQLDEVEAVLRTRLQKPLTLRVDRVFVSAEGVGSGNRWGVVREISF